MNGGGPPARLRALPSTARLALEAWRLTRRAAPRLIWVTVALQVGSAVVVALQLVVIKSLVARLLVLAGDTGLSGSAIVPQLVALTATTFAAGAAAAGLVHAQRYLGEVVARRMLDQVMDVAAEVSLSAFEDPAFYDHLSRATQASTFRPFDMVSNLLNLLLAAATSVGVVIALLTLEPLLLPLVLVAGLPLVVVTLTNARRSYGFEYGLTANARERQHLVELQTEISSAKELRVFAASEWLRRRYDVLTDERIIRLRAFLRRRLQVSLAGVLASSIGTALALSALAWLVTTGRSGIATVATAAIAMQVLAARLQAMTTAVGSLVESGLFLGDLQAFLARGQEGQRAAVPAGTTPAGHFESLEVRDLSFTYPGTDATVLDQVSLSVGRGQVIAIVGENGSGKTTLVKLLCRLYEHDRGTIAWNGNPIESHDPDDLRRHMTVLFQDFVRYHLSVSDNIALGRAEATQDTDRVRQAAVQAQASTFIDRLPSGFDTRLGRRFSGGIEISGGEWQRLALARAFYRGGEFLIMDEPTAAMDPRAEYELFSQMRSLAAGRSVILISHRFANVKMADRIYVLEAGRVVEDGSHDSLMAADGLYAELFRLQARAYR